MATNARNTDPSTSHASDPASIRAADRRKVKELHIQYKHRGLADWELEDLCGGAMNGKWRKRRSDLSVGTAADCEKILMMAEERSDWPRTDIERRNPRSKKMQKVWILIEERKSVEIEIGIPGFRTDLFQ